MNQSVIATSPFRQAEYLGAEHEPRHRVRCPIHGFIRFSDAEREIIDHRIFRRLRWIRQLALTELVYPGATHTRFEHSVGVMELATRIFDRLAAESGALLEEVFSEVEILREDTMAKARQACRLAALLHDTGHCCFSHAAESVIHRGADHEALTVQLLREPDFLGNILEGRFFSGCSQVVANLIKPEPNSPPQIRLLRDIVSGQIDADRTDYLLRDSYHCGVEYGRFDHRRLIECLTVWRNEDTGELEMAINRDGIHSFESLILARYQMNTQVYYHRLRRIYDLYLKRYFECLGAAEFDSPDKILDWNDVRAMNRMFQDAVDAARPGHEWAERIVNRRHHRDVFSMDESEGGLMLKRVRKVFQTIQTEFPEVEFLEDLPEDAISIHKIAREDDQEAKGIDFPLMDRGRRTSLGGRSQILKTLPTVFRIGYIFADVADTSLRERISTRCREIRTSI